MKPGLLFLLFIFIATCSYAQEQTLSGRVVDEKTQNPIQNTAIFISGTTIGSITDSLGQYILKLPYVPCMLIADHVSYQAYVKQVISYDDINIELPASVYQINEISVSGKDNRKKNLRYFKAHFIKENQAKIKIINDNVLVFVRNEMSFTANCSSPLVIENKYLGYRIKAIVEEFKVTVYDEPGGAQFPLSTMNGAEMVNLSGYFFYEPLENLTPEKEAKYKENRRISYYGSYRHFLKSVYDDDLSDQGFAVEAFPEGSAGFCEKQSTGKILEDKAYSINADSIKVHYYCDGDHQPIPENLLDSKLYFYQKASVIYPTKETFVVRKNGTSPQLTFTIIGEMMVKNFANSLPEDYSPE